MPADLHEMLLAELFDSFRQPITWAVPVFDSQQNITDFEIRYCNEIGSTYFRHRPGQGKQVGILSEGTWTEAQKQEVFAQTLEVFCTGNLFEGVYYDSEHNRYVHVQRSRVRNGVLTIATDRTTEYEALKEQQQQNAFYDRVMDGTLHGIVVLEVVKNEAGAVADFRFISINRRVTELLGKEPGELIGRTLGELYPQDRTGRFFQLFCQALRSGTPIRQELQLQYVSAGSWYDFTITQLGDRRLLVNFDDITEKKQALIAREQKRLLLHNILKHSASGITVTETIRGEQGEVVDFRIIIANEAAQRITGHETYLQKTLRDLNPEIMTSPLVKGSLNTLATGTPFVSQYFSPHSQRWLEMAVSKMDDDHLVNIFTDVTREKEAQLQLERSLEELKRSNANLEEFAYVASHDLKEPIRKIHFFANRLKDQYAGVMDENGLRIFDRLLLAAHRMHHLVDDLLTYSQVSMHPAETEEVDLNEKVRGVLGDLELVIEEKKARIELDDLPPIRGHSRQVQQLFQNLISNALKYSKPEVPPVVQIRYRKVDGTTIPYKGAGETPAREYHLIEITDNGIGFDPAEAENIFLLFHRLHGNSEYKGTGVGLSIVRKVVDNHHGFITATSQPGAGATFSLYLPA
ncbi:ATP-binding protein [Paraflavisolibacter sp. H34]|uniref:sensor histidine kinase n=1 Tax=Huijunlia imazamoxiresistens TaxID=3127457 RepID=UPI003019693B